LERLLLIDLKERGHIDATEGKGALSLSGNKALCNMAFGVEDNFRVHLFLTLSWNLMTRLVTTKIINFSFIITK
jgi:hypothetical protein